MLKALKDGAKINPNFQPQNNKQAYLAYLCGLDIALPEPRTVEEILLCKLCTDGGKYLHTMTIRTHLGKITMVLKNNSSKSLTGVYRENTNIFNGATLMLPAEDIGQDEDFYATVIGYEYGGDVGILTIDKDFPFPIIGSTPNAIDVISGEVIDTVTTKDGSKPEQEKTVDITENGATEIFPDEGYVLSKVTANVNVPTASGENKLNQLLAKTITEVTAEDMAGVTKIGDYTFFQCYDLEKITLPNSITSIGKYAFSYSALKNITIPDGVTSIGDYAFQYCDFTSVIIPNNVESIGQGAFYGCNAIKNLTIGNKVTSINTEAFKECDNLIDVIIPNSVQTLSLYVFRSCDSLTSVRIGNGITSINKSFQSCNALTDIYIDKPEGSISGAPWGATSATVHWNTPLPSEEV